jgi:hypothetical protein
VSDQEAAATLLTNRPEIDLIAICSTGEEMLRQLRPDVMVAAGHPAGDNSLAHLLGEWGGELRAAE